MGWLGDQVENQKGDHHVNKDIILSPDDVSHSDQEYLANDIVAIDPDDATSISRVIASLLFECASIPQETAQEAIRSLGKYLFES